MRVVLTQPNQRFPDGRSHVRQQARSLLRMKDAPTADDVVVLPELIGGEVDHEEYVQDVQWLSRTANTWVVGGSHFRREGGARINCGVVTNPSGEIVTNYEKSNPYGAELAGNISPGRGGAVFEVNGLRCLVMICADFWYASSFDTGGPEPDIVLVPALSSSQRPTPHMARARWRHATVARAYEHAAFVAVSDWAHPVRNPDGLSSGVAGFAHPNPREAHELYRPLGRKKVEAFHVDIAAQQDLKSNRASRGFDLTRHLRAASA